MRGLSSTRRDSCYDGGDASYPIAWRIKKHVVLSKQGQISWCPQTLRFGSNHVSMNTSSNLTLSSAYTSYFPHTANKPSVFGAIMLFRKG